MKFFLSKVRPTREVQNIKDNEINKIIKFTKKF